MALLNWVTLSLLSLSLPLLADPTWPSDIDDLEELMYQLSSFQARNFADLVIPCDNEATEKDRYNSAEWLRTAFHDMATADVEAGEGGLDASLQYEINNGENSGPGLRTTLEALAPFVSSRTSLADLIALGVYASVRSCGGPKIPIRAGRRDAPRKGAKGLPQPEDSLSKLGERFDRMGFEQDEAIALTACGHTLGGVHSSHFPDLVDGFQELDTTESDFDNRIITEYLDGTTLNPLVVGPSRKIGKNSDFKMFNSDGNSTARRLKDRDEFRETCKTVLQKMVDTVPRGVKLSEPIKAYAVKPVRMQLTLQDRGKSLLLTGFIRVKTTDMEKGSIRGVTVVYKNRDGDSSCGSAGCSFTMGKAKGNGRGFDDTFAFYGVEASIPALSGISSFTVTVVRTDGSKTTFDNNGEGYPLRDGVFLQGPQTCRAASGNGVKLTAAVRRDRADEGVTATVHYKTVPDGSVVAAAVGRHVVEMKRGACVGEYVFFEADVEVKGDVVGQATVDVTNGDEVDGFKSLREMRKNCRTFKDAVGCN